MKYNWGCEECQISGQICGGKTAPLFCGPEYSVSGISKAGEDIPPGVEATIYCTGVNSDIRVRSCQCPYPFRSGYQAHEPYVPGSLGFEKGDSSRCATTGRQHRIKNKNQGAAEISWKLSIIINGCECIFITINSDVTNPGIWQYLDKTAD